MISSLPKTIIFIACFFYSGNLFSQSKTEIISGIKKEFQKINNDTGYKKITLLNEQFLENMTDGGGQLTGYFKNDSLCKIYEDVGLSSGNEILEFYFSKEQLIFVYERVNSFIHNDTALDYTKKEKTFEGRYYFDKNKMISGITSGHNSFDSDNNDPEKILIVESSQKKKLLKSNLHNSKN